MQDKFSLRTIYDNVLSVTCQLYNLEKQVTRLNSMFIKTTETNEVLPVWVQDGVGYLESEARKLCNEMWKKLPEVSKNG